MADKFIYDEKTSSLYSPEGRFLKAVHCPRAKHWNQLQVESADDRARGCADCNSQVLNLDILEPAEVIAELGDRWRHVCVHATRSAGKVVFLMDEEAPPPVGTQGKEEGEHLPVIHTVRGVDALNRAVGMGYWPDVRRLVFEDETIRSQFQVRQHSGTGRVVDFGDRRGGLFSHTGNEADWSAGEEVPGAWGEAIPFNWYYPDYVPGEPIGAYLIPPDLPEGAAVIVLDPLEDFVGKVRGQGDSRRAEDVPGKVVQRRVVIDADSIVPMEVIG